LKQTWRFGSVSGSISKRHVAGMAEIINAYKNLDGKYEAKRQP